MLDETVTQWSIWAALVCYLLAALLELRDPSAWRRRRFFWTLAAGAYLVHAAAAFHFYHGWSHAEAWRHIARQTYDVFGWPNGAGVWVNYAFTLVWTADALWWLAAPASRMDRPRWIGASLHGWILFMAFFGGAIFETGPTRWATLAGLATLAMAWGFARNRQQEIEATRVR